MTKNKAMENRYGEIIKLERPSEESIEGGIDEKEKAIGELLPNRLWLMIVVAVMIVWFCNRSCFP